MILSIIIAFALIFFNPFQALAAPATPSEATPAVAMMSDFDIMPLDSDPGSAAGGGYIIHSQIWSKSQNKQVSTGTGTYFTTSSGCYFYRFPALADSDLYYRNMEIYFPSSSMPSAGTYGFTFTLYEGNINLRPTSGIIRLRGRDPNVSDNVTTTTLDLSSNGSGSINYLTGNVVLRYDTASFSVALYWPEQLNAFDIGIPIVDAARFTFATNSGPTANPPGVSQEPEQAVAANTGQIANNTAQMQDTLKEIVQTISQQIEALWNQQYNYIHLEDMANADKNADKIVGALSGDINVQIENDGRIAQEIIENNNANTDKLANGYDNSGMNSDNTRLQNQLDEYTAAENAVLDKVNDSISDFDFDSSFDSYLAPISTCSIFIQQIYDNSGGFKDVINISLLLSVASIVIGIYRFKEGG